nr:probable UDP-3-O-acylglucosamine N-acyltransferase 2, mitochondrial [Ipomoea batatas]
MASRIPRLAALRSFSSISTLIGCKSYRQPLFPPKSGLFNSAHTHFSKNQSVYKHSSSEIDSTLKDCNEIGHEEFQKWGNGGGTFHKSSSIDPTAIIEIGAVIHAESVVAANVHVGSGSIIGPAVTIGQSTRVGFLGIMLQSLIAQLVIFVFSTVVSALDKMNLNVRIGAHVEIGANTCIDRGRSSWRDTVIGDHSKIDNLVQIGHNVVIGKNCMLCGQVGIAGSVTIGDYVTMGGRVAIRDHVCIASKVRLAANSCVTKDINEPGDYGGFPAVPIREWRRQVATHRQSLK